MCITSDKKGCAFTWKSFQSSVSHFGALEGVRGDAADDVNFGVSDVRSSENFMLSTS